MIVVRGQYMRWDHFSLDQASTPRARVHPPPPSLVWPLWHDNHNFGVVSLDFVQDLINDVEVGQNIRHAGAPVLRHCVNGI